MKHGTACARLVNVSWHGRGAICARYVELVPAQADFSTVRAVTVDETSRCIGHTYVTVGAEVECRAAIFVIGGRDAEAIEAVTAQLRVHGGDPEAVESVSIDNSRVYIKGLREHHPDAAL